MKLLLLLVAALMLPPVIIISRNGDVIEILPMLLSSFGIALVLYALTRLLKKLSPMLATMIGVLLLMSALMIRYLLGFLYDYSGRGFSSEFFAHINPTAFKISLHEYNREAWVILIVFSLFAFFTARLIRKQREIATLPGLGLLIISLSLIYVGASASPELQLAQAYNRYSQPNQAKQGLSIAAIREQSRVMLEKVRLTQALPIEKSELKASLPEKPLNLILVYLESFNQVFSESVDYPGLTPRIDALKQRYHSFDQIHSSGYVTIEGIANSQCGTLMNMEYANSSLITRKGRLPDLPCLGDILHTAGYKQIYLGGAGLDFAGKGAFFREHGYDQVWGSDDWIDLGLEQSFNEWGLADTMLFSQAFEIIQQQHAQATPFNVTMLTLGMHIPGFVYDGCPQYTDEPDKPYVNAIHCTDFLLGEFVDKLEQSGILEDTVLFIQADHGTFITPAIVKQFGKTVADTRLLTLMALPDSVQHLPETLGETIEGTNLNTVASILDTLRIEHNTGFIFAKSHFKAAPAQNYYVTRRHDYANMQKIKNDRYRCGEPERAIAPVLPLDGCDKNRIMQAISDLNLSYANYHNPDSRICEFSAEVATGANSDTIKIKWGNQNLSDQFYRRGSKRDKYKSQGIYAVILDEHNTVMQALFYEFFLEEDMQDMQALFRKATDGQRMLLIRNVDMTDLRPEIVNSWPEQLREHSIVYGVFKDQKLLPEFLSTDLEPNSRFKPASCNDSGDV
jgi:membrane-anchored protein YejM (alkaline phosphatase superfamily)